VHQIRFRPGLSPGPRWGVYSAPSDPLAGSRGPYTSKGKWRGGKERGKEREGSEGTVKEGKGTQSSMGYCI